MGVDALECCGGGALEVEVEVMRAAQCQAVVRLSQDFVNFEQTPLTAADIHQITAGPLKRNISISVLSLNH